MPHKKDSDQSRRLVTIVEGLNAVLRERYITTTLMLPHEFVYKLEQQPPAALRHWKPEHKPRFRCLHYAIAAARARDYVKHHRQCDPRPGWKDIVRVRR